MKKKETNPGWEKAKEVLATTGKVLAKIGKYIYKCRSVILAIPVVYGAVRLALYAQANLPEQVGINLKETGEYAMMVNRNTAILVSLGITGVCLLMMFISRKTIYPWLISLFSLALPLLLILTNMLPT